MEAESRTVVVKSQSLDQDQEELCHLYFENERCSGGGHFEEEGIVWNEEQRCFFITFVDSHVARRVASREHILNNSPVQVQLWSPARSSGVAVQEDRVLVSGVPPATTPDCLQNYLECVLGVDVASVMMNKGDKSALIIFEPPLRNMDVEGMERACQDNPLDQGSSLSFHEVPVSTTMAPAAWSIVRVTGLGSETANNAVQYFFSNKRRNAGGPIKLVVRDPGSSTALVHFENPADAESVVKKGSHVLDGQSLCVSLYEASHSGDRTGQQGAAFPSHGTAFPPKGTAFSPQGTAFPPQETAFPPQGTKFPSHGTAFPPHGAAFPSYGTAFPPQGTAFPPQGTAFPHQGTAFPREGSFPGSQASGNGPPQVNMASGAGAYRESPGGYQHQAGPAYSNQSKDKYGSFFKSQNASPAGPGFQSDTAHVRPHPGTVRMELGAEVIQKILNDNTLLKKLIEEMRSVQSRYQWERPDHIVITCRLQVPGQNWESHVDEMMNRFVQPIRLQLQREREYARQEAADNPERTSWRDTNSSRAMEMSSSVNSPVGSARDLPKPPSLGNMEDIIPNLKPAQMKILRLPKTMEKLKKGYPGLEISVDEDQKIATVRAPESSMKKAYTDVLTFVISVREMKIPLSPAMALMYKKKDAEDWIQKTLVERYDLLCHWEASDDHIILSGQGSDLSRQEQILKSVFKEASCSITEKDACLLKSPAWTSFLERMQEMDRGGCPTPVLLPEETQIIIVDTPSKLRETRLALTQFCEEKRLESKTSPSNLNRMNYTGFRPEFVDARPPPRTVRVELGADVIQKIINDKTLLTKMIEEIRSVQSRYQWERPDHIVIICRLQDPGQNWESHVGEMMNRFVRPIRLQLQRERECARQETADNPERTAWRDTNRPSANDMSSSVNSPIERVQNPHLYHQYIAKKAHLEKQNPGIENEKILWHGTSADAITNINHHGFNRSYCGKNVAEHVAKMSHRVGQRQLEVTVAPVEDPTPPCTVILRGCDLDKEEIYHLYFENPKRGGGDIAGIVVDKDQQAIPITFEDPEEKKQEMPLPTHWAPLKGDKVKRVELKPDSSEYKRVAEHFGGGGQAQIKKIERIQNPALFQQFKVKKKELDQYNPKGTENEKRLFHGTSSDSVDGIIDNGFNRSYCGKNGTALGNGVYFAAQSSTSMSYAQGRQMFQARVLVGEYTQGNSSMRMAPNKPGSNRPFDSVANASQNANVFVIFHDAQAYPEYLISF